MSNSMTGTAALATTTVSLPGTVANGTWPAGGNATTSTSTSTTVLVLPQLTTPWVAPAHCTPVQDWTAATALVTMGETFRNATYSQILLPVTDAQYSACQPPGWDDVEHQYRSSYSIAVCPSGYNYNQLSDIYHNEPNTDAIRTTAYCCPSGFKYTMFFDAYVDGISGINCVKTTALTDSAQPTTTATTSGSTPASTTERASIAARNATASPTTKTGPSVVTMLYQPWHIEWEKKDTSLLSPTPPVVSVQNPVSTWEPGTEIDPSLTRKQTNPNAINRNLGQIIGIVVGCVGAAFAVIGGILIWIYVRSRRRRRQEFEREEHQLQEQRLQRIGEYQPTYEEPLPVYVKSRDQDKATIAIAVPPYKERPSSDSSRRSRQETQDAERNRRQSTAEDSDGHTLHDQQTTKHTTQNGTHTHGDGNQRHE